MNMAVHGLNGKIKSGDEANTFYHDAHNLNGCCDYIMANPPFNVDKVKSETAESAGRLPFGLPSVNKAKEIGNANYLWISYFYSYLNEKGRAGFVMASSATDSQGKDKNIREELIKTGSVDVMISVANNFFYTKSLPCSLWFFDKAKAESIRDKVLFIDARNYYTVVDRTLNEWTDWQLKNINAIVWLYRGEIEKYKELVRDYHIELMTQAALIHDNKTHEKMALGASFTETLQSFEAFKADQQELAKFDMEKIIRKDKKKRQAEWDQQLKAIDDVIATAKEAVWLYEKFGEGKYQDIPGLCKITDLGEIESKNWSLTPGAYVGVAPVEDDGVDFNERMKEIHTELLQLQAESNDLMKAISENLKEMGL